MQSLTPCPRCRRHVMTREVVCPFCAADVAGHMASLSPRPLPRTRLSRSALFVFGATAALSASSLAGCSDDGHDAKGKPRDASTTPDASRDASDDARAAVSPDAAPATPSDAASLRDARASSTTDSGDAGLLQPADAGTQRGGEEDAGDDFGIPIYALVAPPQKAPDERNGPPTFAAPASTQQPAPGALDTNTSARREDEPTLT